MILSCLIALIGVRASIELERTGDPQAAIGASNPDVAPHLSFVDVGGHGYTTVRAFANRLEVKFVCIPRLVENNGREDGGPLWKPGERPGMERIAEEGTLPLVL